MSSFKWEGNLIANLHDLDDHVMKGIYAAAQYSAAQGESFMKTEAPWTDRTGAARNGLRSKVYQSSKKVAIVFYHTVPYGVYLELRWDGKFAIIEPTMAAIGPLFVETVGRLVLEG